MSTGGGRRESDATVDSAHGWVIVAGAFVSLLVTFAVAFSFPTFFDPMAEELGAGRASTSLVFSITAFTWFAVGVYTGKLTDRAGPRRVLFVGAAAIGLGLLLTSRVNQVWVGYITYGGGVGLGVGCTYVPLLAVVGGWFRERRPLAIGLTVAGIGVGTMIGAPLAAVLIDRYGWRTAFVIIGVGACTLLFLSASVAEQPPLAATVEDVRLGDQVRSRPFALIYSSGVLFSVASFVPLVFLTPYAIDEGIGSLAAASLVSIVGLASTVARFALGPIARRYGVIRTFRATVLVLASSFFIWLFVPSFAGLAAFGFTMGFSYGGFSALSPVVAAELFGEGNLGGVIGAYYTCFGIGALVGVPLAGLTIDITGAYESAIVLAMVLCYLSYAALRPLQAGLATGRVT